MAPKRNLKTKNILNKKASTRRGIRLDTREPDAERKKEKGEELNDSHIERETDESHSSSPFSTPEFDLERGRINERRNGRRKRRIYENYNNKYDEGNDSNIHKPDIPGFNIDEPLKWSADVEAVFNVFGEKNQKRKVKLVAGVLPTELIKRIKTPLGENCFDELVKIIEKKYAHEGRKQLREIFSKGLKEYEMPTDYLERVRKAIGPSNYHMLNQNDPNWLKEVYIWSIPIKIRPFIYAKMKTHTLDEVAEVTEDMIKCMTENEEIMNEGNHQYRQVYHLQQEQRRPFQIRDNSKEDRQRKDLEQINRGIRNLQEEIKGIHKSLNDIQLDLKKKEIDIDALKRRTSFQQNRPQFELRGRSQFRARSVKRKLEEDLCHFHAQYGHKSFKCNGQGCVIEPLVDGVLRRRGQHARPANDSEND